MFLESILALKQSDPKDTIAELYRMFSSISTMDLDHSISAYQTVRTIAEESELIDDPMIQRILRALVIQMRQRLSEYIHRPDSFGLRNQMSVRVIDITEGMRCGVEITEFR